MPSPVGHGLAGLAAAWAADLLGGTPRSAVAPDPAVRSVPPASGRRSDLTLPVLCAVLGAAPDVDLLFGIHRTATHSVSAALLVTIVAGLVTGWVTRRTGRTLPVVRTALTCGAAYTTHLLLDWLAVDPNAPSGIQLFWFPPTERSPLLAWRSLWVNVRAAVFESGCLLPVLAVLRLGQARRARRLQRASERSAVQ
jgi:membrane-bound metal-dependent hydrolase YbcI (DUF457 family)